MVDKVTAENKRIAKASAARGPAGAGIFELPTFAKGMTPQMLFDLAKDRGAITPEQQADFTRRVGKDRRALAEFNELVAKAGYPKLKYQGIQPELLEVFRSQGTGRMTAANKPTRVNTTKIAQETFDEVNAMDAPKETKIKNFVDKFMSRVPDVSPQAVMNLARKFVSMFFGGPSTFLGESLANDPEFQQRLLSNPSLAYIFGAEQPQMYLAGGGIATMDDMIRPIGMAGGGNPMDELISRRASLVGMINAERGVPGVLGGGMDEEKLRVLQIELDQIDRMISMIQGKGEE